MQRAVLENSLTRNILFSVCTYTVLLAEKLHERKDILKNYIKSKLLNIHPVITYLEKVDIADVLLSRLQLRFKQTVLNKSMTNVQENYTHRTIDKDIL